jgi:phenylalanyl-tRNA synthetase beta chain
MLFSTNLLKKYISLNIESKNLMSTMTLHACEVEHVDIRKIPELVVIGYVLSTVKHPNADTLTICQLDCGSHGQYQICTAADNIRADIYVPVALPGCYLPAIDLTIWARQMRWEDSNGMICAKVELGINEDADKHGIWIMEEDFSDLSKEDIWQSVTVKHPRLDNMMLDVDNKTINNRPDLTGLLGMAIEMRAIFRANNTPEIIKHENITHVLEEHSPIRTLELLNHATPCNQQISLQTDKCSVYSLLQIDNISVRTTPFYDRLSLIDSGLSSKNNWVDFSNLFMTISGQPIHCFDVDKIKGVITIREAKDGEKFIDLTGIEHNLIAQDIVIADDSGVIALAGVIWWLSTAISDSTKNIVIEMAHFDPVAVRRTSMRIGVRTDAVMRFEKTLSPLLSLTSLSLILDILKQYTLMLGEYRIAGMSAVMNDLVKTSATSWQYILFDPAQCIKIIFGCEIQDWDEKMMQTILQLLGFQIDSTGQVRIPRRRGSDDMNISEDLYEEIARLYGYNRIEPSISKEPVSYKPFQWLVYLNRICEDVLVHNYKVDQLQTYPWCDESFFDLFGYDRTQLVQLRNAVSPELSYLRPSLIPNLLLAVAKNSKIYPSFTLFDSGQTWNKLESFSRYLNKQSFETTKLWLVSYKKSVSDRKEDTLLEVKSMVQWLVWACGLEGKLEYIATDYSRYHPKKQGQIIYNGQMIGMIAQLHPTVLETLKIETIAQVVVAELFFETLDNLLKDQWYSFQSDAEYQTIQDQIVTRDLCFVIDTDRGFGEVSDVVKKISGVQQVDVFDLYQWEYLPEGKKSIALTLTIVGDGSWTTDQINTVMNTAIAEVEKIWGKLR